MLISDKLLKGINQQISNELGASVEYIHIAAYFAWHSPSSFSLACYASRPFRYLSCSPHNQCWCVPLVNLGWINFSVDRLCSWIFIETK